MIFKVLLKPVYTLLNPPINLDMGQTSTLGNGKILKPLLNATDPSIPIKASQTFEMLSYCTFRQVDRSRELSLQTAKCDFGNQPKCF